MHNTLNNLLFFVDNINLRALKETDYFFDPSDDAISCDILTTLIPLLFCSSKSLQDKAILFLLKSWSVFPALIIDANQPAKMYTVIYTLTLIFTTISSTEKNFKSVL